MKHHVGQNKGEDDDFQNADAENEVVDFTAMDILCCFRKRAQTD